MHACTNTYVQIIHTYLHVHIHTCVQYKGTQTIDSDLDSYGQDLDHKKLERIYALARMLYICTYIHTYILAYITYIPTIYGYLQSIHMHVQICTCMHACMHAFMHTHVHAYSLYRSYTQMLSCVSLCACAEMCALCTYVRVSVHLQS
jgi:hypothetical protein